MGRADGVGDATASNALAVASFAVAALSVAAATVTGRASDAAAAAAWIGYGTYWLWKATREGSR